MSAFAKLTLEIEGHCVSKWVRVRDRVGYSKDDERRQTEIEIRQHSKQLARELAVKVHPRE